MTVFPSHDPGKGMFASVKRPSSIMSDRPSCSMRYPESKSCSMSSIVDIVFTPSRGQNLVSRDTKKHRHLPYMKMHGFRGQKQAIFSKVPEKCRKSAGKVPEKCRKSAGGPAVKVPEKCRKSAGNVFNDINRLRVFVPESAGKVPEISMLTAGCAGHPGPL